MSVSSPAPGLPIGHIVTCVDKDTAKIARLERGGIPILETG